MSLIDSAGGAAPSEPGSRRSLLRGLARLRRRRWLVLSAVALAAAIGGLIAWVSASEANGAARDLEVLPFPGTPDASPLSQISFPELKPSQLGTVSVLGSVTGRHSGRVRSLPGGTGATFVPDHHFASGERVSVAASSSSGQLNFAFTVATPASEHAPKVRSTPDAAAARSPVAQTQRFRSRPDLHPPIVKVSGRDPDSRSGDILLDAQFTRHNGPEILDSRGRLIFFDSLGRGVQAFNTQVQHYRGHSVLTYWRGHMVEAHGAGKDLILDRSYKTIATVRAGAGYRADLHEFHITGRGTALLTAYADVHADLSSVGGPRNGTVWDGIIQEVDIRTGQVMWEWHALGHVPLTASYQALPGAGRTWDFFHINSIQALGNGTLLISARNTWTVYEVSRRTGRIVWQLGGKNSSFKMGPNTQFELQHDARLHAGRRLTLFDNATRVQESESRAMTLKLDTHSMQASLVESETHSPPLYAGSQGSVQKLVNGHTFVGWGSAPYFSEYSHSGRQLFTAQFQVPSYRAFRSPWTGRPKEPPALAVRGGARSATAYASWNGATDVAFWQLLGEAGSGTLRRLARVPRSGFETAIRTRTTDRYLAVRALDRSGRVLGTSATIRR